MYVCIYIYVSIYVYVCIYIPCIYMFVCIHMYMYVCMYIYNLVIASLPWQCTVVKEGIRGMTWTLGPCPSPTNWLPIYVCMYV